MRTFLIPLGAVAARGRAPRLCGGRSERGCGGADPGCAKANLNLVKDGQLTIGTDNPAYPPWFGGGENEAVEDQRPEQRARASSRRSPTRSRSSSASPRREVEWVYTPFNRTIAPGRKAFDFDINQISYTPQRAKVVTFSASYYNVNQAIVALKGNPIARSARGPA